MSTEREAYVEEDPKQFATFGPFRLFPSARLLESEGTRVELGGRALEILLVLVAHAGEVPNRRGHRVRRRSLAHRRRAKPADRHVVSRANLVRHGGGRGRPRTF